MLTDEVFNRLAGQMKSNNHDDIKKEKGEKYGIEDMIDELQEEDGLSEHQPKNEA